LLHLSRGSFLVALTLEGDKVSLEIKIGISPHLGRASTDRRVVCGVRKAEGIMPSGAAPTGGVQIFFGIGWSLPLPPDPELEPEPADSVSLAGVQLILAVGETNASGQAGPDSPTSPAIDLG
jgi:hypothetical protein